MSLLADSFVRASRTRFARRDSMMLRRDASEALDGGWIRTHTSSIAVETNSTSAAGRKGVERPIP
jgi:hypothetical protein